MGELSMTTAKSDSSISANPQVKDLAFFVSDVHLSNALPHTTECFLSFLHTHAINAEHVYLLGDLFEYWAGDDDCEDSFNQRIIKAFRELSDIGVKLFWIAGNRDFLVGENFAKKTGVQLLPDPSQIHLAGHHFIISHGDALCTDDTSYMTFRAMVRQPEWQSVFLSRPLAERKAIIFNMRKASNAEQQNKSMEIMDVNLHAVNALLQQYPSSALIHGHTHRNATHQEEYGMRYVLPDWDCDQDANKRGGWLRLDASGKLEFMYVDSLVSQSTN
jgi:UDP-2,3-diacylglucosamine hydrolase